MMSPLEKRQAQQFLILKMLPPANILQKLIIELGAGAKVAGKSSLDYKAALANRNEYLIRAFAAMPGKPRQVAMEMSNRIIFGRYGDDELGRWLARAADLGCRLPSDPDYILDICRSKKSEN